jgi:polyprenyl P-hydroxybenzoate/phenylacrylic acid decarboxylase-like protein
MKSQPRLIVGMSGSSAPHFGVALLRALRDIKIETHFVMSEGARKSVQVEMDCDWREVESLADIVYDPQDMAAAISSGSFLTMGMVVIPCSMRSLAAIATGMSDNLLARAADVTLKERRKLVLVARETPLSYIHLRNMETVTQAGAIVLPPVPGFYHRPRSIEDLLNHICGKVLDQFGIEHDLFRRWS